MIRTAFFAILCASAFLSETTAFAQINIDSGLFPQPNPKSSHKTNRMLTWGGAHLIKATPEMQTKLGLEETEGLVVAAIEPNTDGEKAGLKVNDVLIKVGDKSVPNDAARFSQLFKDRKPTDPVDLVVVRDGKQQTLKGAKMPAAAQMPTGPGDKRINVNPFFQIDPFIPINPRMPFVRPVVKKLHLETEVDGASVIRDQTLEKFSGEYSKGELKITVDGKFENGLAKPGEITVTQGKEMKKYALRDTPLPIRLLVQQHLMPSASSSIGPMLTPISPDIQELLRALDMLKALEGLK
jgi:PDZ domain